MISLVKRCEIFFPSQFADLSGNVLIVTRCYLIPRHIYTRRKTTVKVIWKTVHFRCGCEWMEERLLSRVSRSSYHPPSFQFMKFAYKYYVHYPRQDEHNREYKRSRISAFACELFQFLRKGSEICKREKLCQDLKCSAPLQFCNWTGVETQEFFIPGRSLNDRKTPTRKPEYKSPTCAARSLQNSKWYKTDWIRTKKRPLCN